VRLVTDSPDDALYAAPLEAFVAERARLVAELRRAGDRAGAAAVAKAGKPTVSAWVINQLARREGDAVRRLAEASARLRGAQLAGPDPAGGGREAFAAASAAHRAAMADVRRAAEHILVEGGHGATPATLERITRNLRAMVTSDEMARQIQAGRLVADLSGESFGDLSTLASSLPASAPRPRPTPVPVAPAGPAGPPSDARARANVAARAAEEARQQARLRHEQQTEVTRLARLWDVAAGQLARARAIAERTRRADEEAQAELRRAEADAEQARVRLATARAALDSNR
jgi:hypothetical protein